MRDKMILADVLVQWKVRLGVAGAMASLVIMPYLFAREMQQQLLEWGFNVNFLLIIVFGTCMLLGFGYLYDKLGFLEREQGYVLLRNKEWSRFTKNDKRRYKKVNE